MLRNGLRLLQQNFKYSRADFSSFFRRKYFRLLKAALRKEEKRLNFSDAKVRKYVVDLFVEFNKLEKPEKSPLSSRHVWMLWQQGWDNAPDIVKACARSWQEKNPDWEIHLLSEETIADYAPAYNDIIAPKASRTAKANIARLSLLKQHGGVWADATVFCQQPLNDWLPKVMNSGFFTFSYPRPYRYCDIWFMASNPNTHLTNAWLEMVKEYWHFFSRPHHYYWMEYLFEFLVEKDSEVANVWQQTVKLSALGPHFVQALAFDKSLVPIVTTTFEENIFPIQKLTHKWRLKGSLKNTPVGLLTGLDHL